MPPTKMMPDRENVTELSLCEICTLLIRWDSSSKTSDISSKFVALESEKNDDDDYTGKTESSSSSGKMRCCSICLGILQPGLRDRVVSEVREKLRIANYDIECFNLALSLPPSCVIREKICRLLKEKGSSTITTTTPPPTTETNNDECDVVAVVKQQPAAEAFQLSVKDACRLCYQAVLQQQCFIDASSSSASNNNTIAFDAQSDFSISVTFENHNADELCDFLRRCFPDRFPSSASSRRRLRRRVYNNKQEDRSVVSVDGNNSEWSRGTITDILPSLTSNMVDEFDLIRPLRDCVTAECTFSTSFKRAPLFIGGRYCKYSRYLSQTPWIVDGVRRGQTSVQELICDHVTKAITVDDIKFTSSGREDIDVRMLGDGRPFAIQCTNPRRKRTVDQAEVNELRRRINTATMDIRVEKLRVVSAQEFGALKVGEENKQKTYVALIWCSHSLGDETVKKRVLELKTLQPIEIDQKTPIRVLHRRPLASRSRTVGNFGVILMDEHRFQLRLTTQAGTYVKEFVHGDFGRTKPSLSDLLGGIPVDILELDVERIDLAWP